MNKALALTLFVFVSLATWSIPLSSHQVYPVNPNQQFNHKLTVQPTRTEGWRLAQQLQGGINADTTAYYHKYEYFYNPIRPDKPDSMLYYYWVYENQPPHWSSNDHYRYYYDQTGEYLTTLEYYFVIGQTVLNRITGAYTANGRLAQAHISSWYVNSSMIPYIRTDFSYDADRISSITSYSIGTQQNDSYARYVYTYDTQGRIVTELQQISEDSLNWVDNHRKLISYHPEDNSDGSTYIEYLRDNYLKLHFSYLDLCPGTYAMTSEVVYQYINNDVWINSSRYMDSYDESGRLSERVYQSWTDSWVTLYKLAYSYDANGNLSSIFQYEWTETGWSEEAGLVTYTWEQYTANDDDVLPYAAISLIAYPNPFAGSLNIALQSKSNAPVQVNVYNLKGQIIKTLSGSKALSWDGTDRNNQPVSNGIYFIKAEQDGRAVTGKVIRIK